MGEQTSPGGLDTVLENFFGSVYFLGGSGHEDQKLASL
jgi:hypothetical protein